MAIQGPIPVEFDFVFPHGAFAVEVAASQDYDEVARRVTGQARDKVTGDLVWVVDVIDADPQARAKAIRVKVNAPVCPTLPPELAGTPFRPVVFEQMTVTPYVEDAKGGGNQRGRLAYSIKARGMRAPSAAGKPAAKPAEGKAA